MQTPQLVPVRLTVVLALIWTGCAIDRSPGPAAPDLDGGMDAAFDSGSDANFEAGADSGEDEDAGAEDDSGVDGPGVVPPGLGSCTSFRSFATRCPDACSRCDRGLCEIKCDRTASCSRSRLTCPAGFSCLVDCSGLAACAGLQVMCADGPCDVSCTGTNSCVDLHQSCGADACRLTCGERAGEDAMLQGGDSCAALLRCER